MTRFANRWSTKALSTLLCAFLLCPSLTSCTAMAPALAQPPAQPAQPAGAPVTDPWPRQLASEDNTFSIFQPQYERWQGNRLEGRAAVAVENQASPQPKYGVMWFAARSEVDKETRMVALEDLTVSKVNFPTVPDGGSAYLTALRQTLAAQPLTIALDRLQSDVEVTRVENPGRVVPVKNDPPRIFVSEGPALLVRIDGEPVLRTVTGTGLLRVINTRVLLLLDQSAGRYAFWLMNRWLGASTLEGPWTPLDNPPASLDTAKQAAVQSGEVDLLTDPASDLKQLLQRGTVPTIYVTTVAAELIVIRGRPSPAPVADIEILQITNTDSDLFLYTPEGAYYALLSGRWFRATSLQGPWEFVASGKLPQDFAKIPESHPKGAVLASVSGTPQARQAVISNDIPQTATISRSQAAVTVKYDGQPQLKAIDGTPLQQVANASIPVIQVTPSSYYALQNGVWFVGPGATGPWAAATTVPNVIYTIPASSPLHYVTYAYVYGSTPEVVYTGYTPGYMGTVVAPGPSVVYGTGYVYPGWVGSFWYPAPVTWGWGPFALGFGVGVFTGFAFGFGVGAWGGWYGGWGWHGGCCWGWHGGINNVNVYNHWGNNVNVTKNTNITKNTTNIGHVGSTTRISGGHGNVYAGHDGNAYRRDGNGNWQGHNASGGWDSAKGSTAEHEQAHQARQQGQQRVNGYNRQATAHGVSQSYHGGESHGGGGRR